MADVRRVGGPSQIADAIRPVSAKRGLTLVQVVAEIWLPLFVAAIMFITATVRGGFTINGTGGGDKDDHGTAKAGGNNVYSITFGSISVLSRFGYCASEAFCSSQHAVARAGNEGGFSRH